MRKIGGKVWESMKVKGKDKKIKTKKAKNKTIPNLKTKVYRPVSTPCNCIMSACIESNSSESLKTSMQPLK